MFYNVKVGKAEFSQRRANLSQKVYKSKEICR